MSLTKKLCVLMVLYLAVAAPLLFASDLPEIREQGVLRHLGIPYANFVKGNGEGLDVDLIRLFAKELGVRYEYVETSWLDAFSDLTGDRFVMEDGEVIKTTRAPIKGDIIANGLTILPWRKELIDYSNPTFPTGIWVIAKAEAPLKPIPGSGDIDQDIADVRAMLKDHKVLTMTGTCLDSELYDIPATGAELVIFTPAEKTLDDIAPALIDGVAELSLLDVPDALVALQQYQGEIKILGPLTKDQLMACGFRKDSPLLREAFNDFFAKISADGTYRKLVEKHYPAVFLYYADFFEK